MKTICFIRHGEAEANLKGLLAGAKTDSPLTPKGESQAHELTKLLKGKQIDLIVTSPLERASKTAAIVAADLDYTGSIETSELFIERDFGSATNMPKSEAFATLDNGTATAVETVKDFGDRARQALVWLAALPGEYIVVFSHAGFGQMLGTIAAGGDPADFLQFNGLANAGMFEFNLE